MIDFIISPPIILVAASESGLNILYYKIAQFVGNAVGVYTSGHTGAA